MFIDCLSSKLLHAYFSHFQAPTSVTFKVAHTLTPAPEFLVISSHWVCLLIPGSFSFIGSVNKAGVERFHLLSLSICFLLCCSCSEPQAFLFLSFSEYFEEYLFSMSPIFLEMTAHSDAVSCLAFCLRLAHEFVPLLHGK